MSGRVLADRFRPPLFVPFPKNKRHIWQLWFARFPILWRSILETTQLPANRGKKTAERRSVVAGQNRTVEPATVCVRQSSFDNRANRREPQHVLDVPLLASPSVRDRRDQRQPVRTSPATSPMYRSAKVRT